MELSKALNHGQGGGFTSLSPCPMANSFDVVVHGHTHKAEIRQEGETLVVNPGEVCRYLSGRATIALLDTDKQRAEIVEL